jgi:hypothetical protein
MVLPTHRYLLPRVGIINSASAAVCSGMRDIEYVLMNADEWRCKRLTCNVFRSTVLPIPFPAHSEAMLPAFVGLEADVRVRGHDPEPDPQQVFLSAPSGVSKCWQDNCGRAWAISAASQIMLSMDFTQTAERGVAESFPTCVVDCGPGGHSLVR